MKRVAIVFEGKLGGARGVLNAVVERVRHLRDLAGVQPDVFMIEGYDSGVNRLLHRTPRIDRRPERVVVNGVEIAMRWYCHSLADTVRHKLLHRQAANYRAWLSGLAASLKGYAIVSAHDRIAGTVAAMAAGMHGMPHFITWHGASIYTDPPRDPVYRQTTIGLLQGATRNFFVSQGLEDYARRTLTPRFTAEVLYNGASEAFRRFDNEARLALRARMGIAAGERVVGYAGRLEPVKNAALLPAIFQAFAERSAVPTRFVIAGAGSLAGQVRSECNRRGLNCLMLPALPHEQMPEVMNCFDVMVVPSRLEGFGLVAAEAIACGARVVGSNAVGLPEVIGADNAFPLDDSLPLRLAERGTAMLEHQITQSLPPEISWRATARRELEIYQSYLS